MNSVAQADPFNGDCRPPKLKKRRHCDFSVVALVLLAVTGTAGILFFFNPVQHRFYPICYFHAITGLNCPGCGALRAMHQLLHGHVLEAARLNLFLFLCLPYVGWRTIRFVVGRLRGLPATFAIRSVWLWTFLCVAIVFTILRNLPFPALAWMSP
jgi:hypothetical protein